MSRGTQAVADCESGCRVETAATAAAEQDRLRLQAAGGSSTAGGGIGLSGLMEGEVLAEWVARCMPALAARTTATTTGDGGEGGGPSPSFGIVFAIPVLKLSPNNAALFSIPASSYSTSSSKPAAASTDINAAADGALEVAKSKGARSSSSSSPHRTGGGSSSSTNNNNNNSTIAVFEAPSSSSSSVVDGAAPKFRLWIGTREELLVFRWDGLLKVRVPWTAMTAAHLFRVLLTNATANTTDTATGHHHHTTRHVDRSPLSLQMLVLTAPGHRDVGCCAQAATAEALFSHFQQNQQQQGHPSVPSSPLLWSVPMTTPLSRIVQLVAARRASCSTLTTTTSPTASRGGTLSGPRPLRIVRYQSPLASQAHVGALLETIGARLKRPPHIPPAPVVAPKPPTVLHTTAMPLTLSAMQRVDGGDIGGGSHLFDQQQRNTGGGVGADPLSEHLVLAEALHALTTHVRRCRADTRRSSDLLLATAHEQCAAALTKRYRLTDEIREAEAAFADLKAQLDRRQHDAAAALSKIQDRIHRLSSATLATVEKRSTDIHAIRQSCADSDSRSFKVVLEANDHDKEHRSNMQHLDGTLRSLRDQCDAARQTLAMLQRTLPSAEDLAGEIGQLRGVLQQLQEQEAELLGQSLSLSSSSPSLLGSPQQGSTKGKMNSGVPSAVSIERKRVLAELEAQALEAATLERQEKQKLIQARIAHRNTSIVLSRCEAHNQSLADEVHALATASKDLEETLAREEQRQEALECRIRLQPLEQMSCEDLRREALIERTLEASVVASGSPTRLQAGDAVLSMQLDHLKRIRDRLQVMIRQ